jgi:hypothetical protein
MDGLKKEGFVEFKDEGMALREARKAGSSFFAGMGQASELARQRILSQKNPPPEQSPQWNTLYQKYYEEELKRKGG